MDRLEYLLEFEKDVNSYEESKGKISTMELQQIHNYHIAVSLDL